ncbi:hypothetical protein MHU86_24480 [Fragilaria crotonensis]|nr:hypothetical protein MHU86_24480 [Fragilaria crotonensis]
MVQTRSGHDVFYTEASYGRAARNESTRKRRKRKLTQASMREFSADNSFTSTTPQRTPRKTRAQIRQEEELSTPPSTLNRVGRTPPIKTERLLRGKRKPTCSDYGIARHFSFQGNGFFFCHPCDVWDSLPPDQVTKSSRLSARLGCVANHESFSHPTTLCKVYCRQSVAAAAAATFPTNNKDSDSEDGSVSSSIMGDEHEGQHGVVVAAYNCELELEEEEGHATTTTTSTSLNVPECTTTQGHAVNATTHNIFNSTDCNNGSDRSRQGGNGGNCSALVNNQPAQSATVLSPEERNADLILELKGTIQMLQKWNLKLARDIKKLRDDVSADKMKATNNCNSQQNSTAYQDAVLEAIRGVTGRHNRRLNSNRTGVLVANALWNHASFQPHLLKLARKYFRENVFTPYNILREMDLAGGTLSYEGIDVLRRVETCGVKRFRGSIIPSKSEIKRIASVVEWYACQFCPFTSNLTTKGESIEFDFAKSMLCITKAFYLDDIGKTRSLSIASSIDGASLSKNLSIIAGGVKITDLAARCPSTKRPLLDDPLTMSAQSRNLCIPLKIMMGRETKETFTEFGALF